MNNDFSVRGGARVGLMNATWPFATLKATNESLTLNATILGNYTFSSKQIQRIEKIVHIPILGWGIRLYHNVPNYPEKIIFWCLGTPQKIIDKIQEIEFSPSGETEAATRRGYPVRWQAIVGIVAVWNILFFFDQGFSLNSLEQPGRYSLLALVLLFTGSIAIWKVTFIKK